MIVFFDKTSILNIKVSMQRQLVSFNPIKGSEGENLLQAFPRRN